MHGTGLSRLWFWGIFIIGLLYVGAVSFWHPFTGDSYHHAVTGMSHAFDVTAVYERCVQSYMTWNPRLGEFLAFIFATAGKWLFVLVNPVMVMGLVLLMCYMVTGRRLRPGHKQDVWLFSLAMLLLFTSTARPGVTIYWLSGATNYAWGGGIWLGFLCMYRRLTVRDRDVRLGVVGWLSVVVLGFLAGMTNENNIPGAWLLMTAFCVYRKRQGHSLPGWVYAGALSNVAGALCMLFAPGVEARMHSETPGCAEPLLTWGERLGALPELMFRMHEYVAIVVVLIVVAIFVFRYSYVHNRRTFVKWRGYLKLAGAYIVVAYAMAASFCVAVIPADHAMFSATLTLSLGALTLMYVWMEQLSIRPRPKMFALGIVCLTLGLVAASVYENYTMHVQEVDRVAHIKRQLEAGSKHLIVPPFHAPSWSCSYIFWVDLSTDPTDYVNRGAAAYYGVETIVSENVSK